MVVMEINQQKKEADNDSSDEEKMVICETEKPRESGGIK
jgi:hypothetical protein